MNSERLQHMEDGRAMGVVPREQAKQDDQDGFTSAKRIGQRGYAMRDERVQVLLCGLRIHGFSARAFSMSL